ncbi:hypothetical protein ACFSTI_03345 [Rhizorhabdus histidinilytica]
MEAIGVSAKGAISAISAVAASISSLKRTVEMPSRAGSASSLSTSMKTLPRSTWA